MTCAAILVACSRSQPSADGGPTPQVVLTDTSAPAAAPSASGWASKLPGRYAGKPMLVIIESYALSVIGSHSPEQEQNARWIVKRTFGGGDDWRATVRRVMGWPSNVDAEILSNWQTYNATAKADAGQPDPLVFARAFADEFSKY